VVDRVPISDAVGTQARSWWRAYGWWVIGGLAVVSFVLGTVGFGQRSNRLGEAHSVRDSMYRSVQLFVLESGGVADPVPWSLEVARVAAPLVLAYAAAWALVALFRDQARILGLRFLSGHVIVCGLGDKGFSLVRALSDDHRRIVVVERDAENDLIGSAKERGALVLVGDAQDADLLRRAGVASAEHLVAVCGADSTNAEIGVTAMHLVAERSSRPLRVSVHIMDPDLCALLRTEELAMPPHAGFVLEFFNIFEKGARLLLEDPVTSPLDRSDAGDAVLLVVGMGRFGSSVAVQASQRWAASAEHTGGLRITLVSRDATEKRRRLVAHHPALAMHCRVEDCWDIDIESADFCDAPFLREDTSAVYVCLDDDRLAVSAALTLRGKLTDSDVPVVIRLDHATGLGSLLGRGSAVSGAFETLQPYGLMDQTMSCDALVGVYERMAQRLHATWEGRELTRQEWKALADRFKASSRAQAEHTGAKLRAIGCGLAPLADAEGPGFRFHPDEIEHLAAMEHDRWCGWTRARGYVYGEPRIDRSEFARRFLRLKGRHPDLKPWDDLTDDRKDIDRAFVRTLPDVLADVDQRIMRLPDTSLETQPAADREVILASVDDVASIAGSMNRPQTEESTEVTP
jgi:voltage-gated potassium channel Kch